MTPKRMNFEIDLIIFILWLISTVAVTILKLGDGLFSGFIGLYLAHKGYHDAKRFR